MVSLIQILNIFKVKRFLIVGPAGSNRREHCKKLAETFKLNVIETGALLKLEVQKKTDLGAKIQEAFDKHEYVPDQVVCDVLKKRVNECEKENKDFIIEGFPRTKVQALQLNELGIIPDKIILLPASEEAQA